VHATSKRLASWLGVWVFFAAHAACSEGVFACVADEQCGETGVCEAAGYCSFPDVECDSGRRYAPRSRRDLAGTCVPEGDVHDETTGGESPETDAESGSTATMGLQTTGETATPDETGGQGLPDGEECTEDAQCESGMCFVASVVGGICGECLGDDDCDGGGCSIPNPFKDPPEGAFCNMGEQGGGCESTDACQGDQVCALILDVPGIIEASTCSECLDSSQCDGEALCNPHYDVIELSGYNSCVAPGSVANGLGCTIGEEGSAACASGFCADASVRGLLNLGVCSECIEDGDCADGETCLAPEVNLTSGLVAGVCSAG
jgi:hypothetical protein